MEIILKKADSLRNWYTIERKEHDGKVWWKKSKYGASLMMSCRLSPEACVEGEGYEMKELANAIKSKESVEFRRCAAILVKGKGYKIFSPRNSRKKTLISFKDADKLADQILKEII